MAFHLVDDPDSPKRKRRVALAVAQDDPTAGFVDGFGLDSVRLASILPQTKPRVPQRQKQATVAPQISMGPNEPAQKRQAAPGDLCAPMAGRIVEVLVEVGAAVARGMPLIVLEAMKTEQTLVAPADGVVAAVLYRAAQQVPDGAILVRFGARPQTKT